MLVVVLAVLGLVVEVAAQLGGKPATGNPTPGTPQPEPPNLADRITLTGCVQAAPPTGPASPKPAAKAGGRAGTEVVDPNTPSDARFVLTEAERRDVVPAGTGGSALAANTSTRMYRLQAIDSQLSPFVGARVEISGEVKPRSASEGSSTFRQAQGRPEHSRGTTSSGPTRPESPDTSAVDVPTLLVEFVQRIGPSCP